jgi:RHS repeat-associated protein
MTEPNGMYYMRARYYDPRTGRFISQDPLGFDGGDVNLYIYAKNNPVLFSDPLGLWTLSLGVDVNAALGIGGGGGLAINFGFSKKDGFSFSLTGTAQGGAIAGAGAFAGGIISITNADNVNQLNGTSFQVGRAGIGPAFVEGIVGDGYKGLTLGGGVGVGYNAGSATASTTSAIYQYQNGVHSIGNTGKDSLWNSGK